MYGTTADVNPWVARTIGFPPATPQMPNFRPLHVWGHPSVDQSLMYTWPTHLPQPHAWPSPLADPSSLWHPHHQYVCLLITPPPQYSLNLINLPTNIFV